jgi:cyclopropane fatty-acyl-phospholipid synthase-like methyltransferase
MMLHKTLGYKKVIGIDQSVWHAIIARHEMKRLGLNENVEFRVSSPDLLKTVKGLRFDLVISIIVLQHMVPSLMVMYIEQFCDVLNVGGHGYFQVPTYLKADYSQFKCDYKWSIEEGGMQVWYLEHKQVESSLNRRGCRILNSYVMDSIGIPESKSECFFFVKQSNG